MQNSTKKEAMSIEVEKKHKSEKKMVRKTERKGKAYMCMHLQTSMEHKTESC